MKSYNDYNTYLKAKFGTKVYRIGLDAGFSCPNRDGTKGSDGCVYCNADGSRSSYTDPKKPVTEQLTSRIEFLKKKYGATRFIAYFQAFTNTHAPVSRLKDIYDETLRFKEIVGMSIGTRPDSVDKEKLALIASYRDRFDLWIEYGLQSIHNNTLKAINRRHSFEDFVEALDLTKKSGITVSAHVILGLPGETRDDMIQTARKLSELKVDGVKIHLLHILKGSALENMRNGGKLRLLEQDEYAELVCDFLEHLSEDIIIQRLTGQGAGENHIAPQWALDKIGTINRIEEVFKNRGSRQGSGLTTAVRSWSRS